MARSKARVYAVCALLLALLVIVIVCISVFATRKVCPHCAFKHAAVAADSKQCSEVGRDILRRGGSAVDAAIAALLCTSVIHPQSAGLGGGSIFTVMDSAGKVQIFNSRESAPGKVKVNLQMDCSKDEPTEPQFIGVPGEIRGYEAVHKLYGKLPWADLFQPTIKMAREGFQLPEIQGFYVQFLSSNHSLLKFYSDKDGKLLKTGDTIRFETLANTLETIANEGAGAFYNGRIAEDLIRDVQQAGGKLTLQDLASYEVTRTDAWVVPLGEFQMHIPPPPAGAVILSFILNLMKEFNSAPQSNEGKTEFYHQYVEAFKFANGLKKHTRDPRFTSDDMAQKITEESFARRVRALISSNRTHNAQYYNLSKSHDSQGTTHLSVMAEDGSAVSVTSTINHLFGSKIYSPSTGIILNNELRDFCGKVDRINPGERPPSSMAPTVLKSKTKTVVIGASGGSMITTGLASTIINHLWFGKSLKEAIAAPIVFIDSKNALKFESNFDEQVIRDLEALGHKRETARKFYNTVNAVVKTGGCISAESDKRKQGEAAGY